MHVHVRVCVYVHVQHISSSFSLIFLPIEYICIAEITDDFVRGTIARLETHGLLPQFLRHPLFLQYFLEEEIQSQFILLL